MKSAITLAAIAGLIASMGVIFFEDSASAAPYRYRVNQRQFRQQGRVNQGICSGQLNGRETARIEARESRLALQEQRMRASGDGLSKREHARLNREQNNLSRSIYHQKHDAQVR